MAVSPMAAPDPLAEALAVIGQSLLDLANRVAGLEALARSQATAAQTQKGPVTTHWPPTPDPTQ